VKHAALFVSMLLASALALGAAAPVWISFYGWELERAKRAAIAAINSPDVWARFPSEQHKRHYTPIIRDIAFGFSEERGKGSIVTVIIPTTQIGPRHRALVHVTFDQGLKITHIAEVPEI
jgi:hypothetical protein